MPRVSIIIPTYNQADLLQACLESVFAQSYTDFEAILVNNFSTDATAEVADQFAQAHPDQFRRIDFANGGSIAAGRNRGASEAQGEWLAFLDSDDLWEPQKLERCLAALGSADFGCHPVFLLREGHREGESGWVDQKKLKYGPYLFAGNRVVTSTVMVRKTSFEALGGFDESAELITAEDWDLWLRLLRDGARAVVVPELLGSYRIHSGGNSNKVELHFKAGWRVFENHFAQLPDATAQQRRRAEALHLYGAGRKFLSLGEKASGRAYLLRSLKLNPLYVKAWVSLAQALV
ncbi:MAG: glycosyltransferase family A protein [bacterium]|nr:glycosyltransferase family A protein [bacterium]